MKNIFNKNRFTCLICLGFESKIENKIQILENEKSKAEQEKMIAIKEKETAEKNELQARNLLNDEKISLEAKLKGQLSD